MRKDGRAANELRKLTIETGIIQNAQASVLISFGATQVLCTAMAESGVPPFLANTSRGWVTAEYAMLPASTPNRKRRDGGKQDGRGVEIQRLIGRSLRSVCDFEGMGETTIYIDCDVLNADGGTRTASISGAFVALAMCARRAVEAGLIGRSPVQKHIAAISAGIVGGEPMLDLCYVEDSSAEADMNLVMDEDGGIGEVQISGEKRTVQKQEFDELLEMSQKGIGQIICLQRDILSEKGIKL